MARKPLSESTVAENCLKWGTGGINIDESRVGTEIIKHNQDHKSLQKFKEQDGRIHKEVENPEPTFHTGRFPANLIHDGSDEVKECFPESKSSNIVRRNNPHKSNSMAGATSGGESFGFNDSGSASRFFKSIIYQAKSSKSDRNSGGIVKNIHPTCKPTVLMSYLIKMVTPKGGIVLDPFTGSGSTLVAAKQNGFQYVGIEMTPEYIEIAEARLKSIKEKLL